MKSRAFSKENDIVTDRRHIPRSENFSFVVCLFFVCAPKMWHDSTWNIQMISFIW